MSVINFSSVMNTRRHMRARNHESHKETESSSEDSYSPDWEAVAKAEAERREREKAAQAEREAAWGEKWDEQTDFRKNELLSEHLFGFDELSSVGWGQSIFDGKDEDYGTKRTRLIREASTRLSSGNGYYDIKKLRKVISRYPEQKEYAELLIDRVKELDAHNGMTPREYRIAWRQQQKHGESSERKPVRSDLMERYGEELIKTQDSLDGDQSKTK